jgi:hypothetical protein
MKDNQHEQLFTELTAESEALAFQELDDEVAATFSGGEGYTGSSDPDVILYNRSDWTGSALKVNAKITDGLWSLTGYRFNDITSSITIHRGTWEFWGEAGYKGSKRTLGPGSYKVTEAGITNDSLSSLKRIG